MPNSLLDFAYVKADMCSHLNTITAGSVNANTLVHCKPRSLLLLQEEGEVHQNRWLYTCPEPWGAGEQVPAEL